MADAASNTMAARTKQAVGLWLGLGGWDRKGVRKTNDTSRWGTDVRLKAGGGIGLCVLSCRGKEQESVGPLGCRSTAGGEIRGGG